MGGWVGGRAGGWWVSCEYLMGSLGVSWVKHGPLLYHSPPPVL